MLSIANKEILKDVVDSAESAATIRSKFAQLEDTAGELKDERLTITLPYLEVTLVTIVSQLTKFYRLVK